MRIRWQEVEFTIAVGPVDGIVENPSGLFDDIGEFRGATRVCFANDSRNIFEKLDEMVFLLRVVMLRDARRKAVEPLEVGRHGDSEISCGAEDGGGHGGGREGLT